MQSMRVSRGWPTRAVLAALLGMCVLAGRADAQAVKTISTYAGGGSALPGDGGPATAAFLSAVDGLAVNAAGDLHLADYGRYRVKKVLATTGVISTVAGMDTDGSSGDGGAATLALLDTPVGLAFDAAGNLYIADYGSNRIRRVSAGTGTITTVAGTGTVGYNGDGIPATQANVSYPWGIAVNAAGDLFIAEHFHNRIRKVSAATGLISTYAGTGASGTTGDGGPATQGTISSVLGMAIDAAGNIYFAQPSSNVIRVVYAATGTIGTFAGVASGTGGYVGDGGPATLANLNMPYDVAVDPLGILYIADSGNECVRRVVLSTGIISTYAGNGTEGYSGDGGPATQASLDFPTAVAVGPSGELYIADQGSSPGKVIRRVTGREKPAITWATPADIVYGTALSATQLNATTSVAGTFVYDPPAGTLLNAGSAQTLSVTFTPDDGWTYATATATVKLNVLKATPLITWEPPSPIVYGTPLSAAQLNAIANVMGTFVYDPAIGAVLAAGTRTLSTTFTPNDAQNYTTAVASVSLTVSKATPVITWANPSAIVHGTALTVTQLNATASVAGSFVYNPAAGSVLNAGAETLSTTFTPNDAQNYTTAMASVSLTVSKATPVITWANPAPITPGTPLSATQLNATANVAGAFVYTPPAGTTLSLGAGQALSCLFTPTNTTNYNTATKQVTIDVQEGPPTGPPYTLTISPAPTGGKVTGAGINCGAGGTACAVTMPASMTLGVSAAPSAGYTFGGWTGDCSGTSPSIWVDLKGARTCAATFTPVGGTTYSLTIAPAPTGGTVTGNGLTCGAGGATCAVTFGGSTTATLTAAAATGYTFTNWGGACSGTSATTSVLVDAAKTCSATFTATGGGGGLPTGPPYTLTISPMPTSGKVTGAGINCGAGGTACAVTMPASMTLGISAAPSAGYTFGGWSGDCAGTSPSIWVDLKGARTCAATFTPVGGTTYSLTIAPAPTGGTVTGNGLTCGAGGATCAVTFGGSTTATLTAAAATGYTFTNWGGACSGTSATTSVLVDAAKTCSATFTATGGGGGLPTGPPYTLTISPVPTGGKVTGAGINCGAGGTACAVTMPASMTLGVSATPSAGYTFGGWSGDCSGTSTSLWVDLKGARTCAATFTPVGGTTYSLTIAPAPTGGTVTGNGLTCGASGTTCAVTFGGSTTATLTAAAATGYTFTSWGGACSGTSATTSVLVDAAKTCSATFTATGGGGGLPTGPPYTLTISPMPTGGKVTGAGINCGAGGTACAVTMPASMTLGISAAPSAGYTFGGWTGDCTGTTPGLWVSLKGPRTCSAIFTPAGGGS